MSRKVLKWANNSVLNNNYKLNYFRSRNNILLKMNATDENEDLPSAFRCKYCKDDLTTEAIENIIENSVLTSGRKENIKKCVEYFNLYKEEGNLNSCLRKAHFIAQVIVESNSFKTFEEDETYTYKEKINPPGIFSSSEIEIDDTILDSLFDNLADIFVITNSENEIITKTNAELKSILLEVKPKVIDSKLYFKLILKENELLKVVYISNSQDIDYKIFIKTHIAFGVPLLSRMYAPYEGDKRGLGNGNELTRDGWKFKGRGLKQLTGRYIYNKFSESRKTTKYKDDDEGYIDFTKSEDSDNLKGDFLKISSEPKFAVQSALYFWNLSKSGKTCVGYADEDNVEEVSKLINYYDTGSRQKRADYYFKAQKKESFKVFQHYGEMHSSGNLKQKEFAKLMLENLKSKSEEAVELLKEKNEKTVNENNKE